MINNYGPSYILPNGEVLKLQEKGFHTHYEYEGYLAKKNELHLIKFYKRHLTNLKGWIRTNDGTNMKGEHIIELPIKPITEDQYKSLIEFLDYMFYSNKEFIEVGIEENSRGINFSSNAIFFKHYDFKDYLPDDIIKEIRQLYNKLKSTD